jgi:hypothetical protein
MSQGDDPDTMAKGKAHSAKRFENKTFANAKPQASHPDNSLQQNNSSVINERLFYQPE